MQRMGPQDRICSQIRQCPEPVEGLSWVYLLLMSNGMFYVGQTSDVGRRIDKHQSGTGARQTRQMKHFRLVHVEGPMEAQAAISRERQIKRWSRAKKLALITGDLEQLRKLSRSRD